MEYPGSTFTRPIRLAILFFFIALFFIISPTVILYSAGYRYDFKNGLLKETGSLSVDVLPKSATAYLDGLKLDQSMPIRLNNITPHKYTLRLSAPGYYDWEKQIEVNKNQTTYVKQIVMLKKDKPRQLSKDKADRLAVSNSGRFLAYTTSEQGTTHVFVADQQLGTTFKALTLPENNLDLRWAQNAEYFAVFSKTPPFKTLVVVSGINPSKNTQINNLTQEPIIKFMWSKNTEPELYYSTKEGVWSYLARLGQSRLITPLNFEDWFLEDGSLWTLQVNTSTDHLAITEDALGFNATYASLAPSDASINTSTLTSWRIENVQHGTVLLHSPLNNQYLIVRPNDYFLVNASESSFSKYNNWWLLWGSYELWTYSEGDEPFLLNRSGAALHDVQPLDQFNTLALLWGDEVTALYPYFYTERTIVSGQIKTIAVDTTSRILYYTDDSGLWRIGY